MGRAISFLCGASLILKDTSATTKNIRAYWIKKHQFGRARQIVDWNLIKCSNKNSSYSRNRWLSKFCTGFCGTGEMLEIYIYQTHSNCPRCSTPKESTAHVLQCTNKEASIEWDTNVEALKKWMLQQKISPDLTHIIVSNINAWKYKAPRTHTLPTSPISKTSHTRTRPLEVETLYRRILDKQMELCKKGIPFI